MLFRSQWCHGQGGRLLSTGLGQQIQSSGSLALGVGGAGAQAQAWRSVGQIKDVFVRQSHASQRADGSGLGVRVKADHAMPLQSIRAPLLSLSLDGLFGRDFATSDAVSQLADGGGPFRHDAPAAAFAENRGNQWAVAGQKYSGEPVLCPSSGVGQQRASGPTNEVALGPVEPNLRVLACAGSKGTSDEGWGVDASVGEAAVWMG